MCAYIQIVKVHAPVPLRGWMDSLDEMDDHRGILTLHYAPRYSRRTSNQPVWPPALFSSC